MPKYIELTGQRFGKLVVLKRVENAKDGATRFLCQCDCGNTKVIRSKHLKSGAISDCGCEKSQRTRNNNLKHGGSGTRLYNIWIKMRDRCKNPHSADWADYGGRGITVCDKWDSSFESFRKWAESAGYEKGKSIDRIDVNSGYYPDNCRWVSTQIQANNKRNNHIVSYHGKKMSLADVARLSTVPYGTIKRRICVYGWSVEEAVEVPV